ncbi:helix-turn-helix transcriptional regulator [Paenibacillus sp. TAB 01]|uniref:helix-turn-helix transcriptional regulator n=1 Tax=Paenibacillus sp. TAB 01 TaxID=3368988 RepID=UPI003750560D
MILKRLWLNKIRTSRSKTHLEVASNSGIKRQYYGMIENGVSNPSVEVAKAIATYLEFDWTLFLRMKAMKHYILMMSKPQQGRSCK